MNAMQIMGFLLLLNLAISSMSMMSELTGGHFYDISSVGTVPDNYTISEMEDTDFGLSNFATTLFGVSNILGLLGGVVLGSIVSWATRVPADKSFLYSMFVSLYIATSAATISLLWSFTEQGNEFINTPLYILIVIFVAIVTFSFISFVSQLIGGGWNTYQ